MLLSANTKLVKNWILKEVKIVKIVQLYVNNLHLSLKLYYLCRGLYSPDHLLLQSTCRAWARWWHKWRRFCNSFFCLASSYNWWKIPHFFKLLMKYCPNVLKLFAVASSLWHLMEPLNIMFCENLAQILFYCPLMNGGVEFYKKIKNSAKIEDEVYNQTDRF